MSFLKYGACVLFVTALAACEPYEFTMSRETPVDGRILTPLSTVTPGSVTTVVHDDGAIQLTNFGISEYSLTFGLRVVKGSGVDLLIHPRVEVGRVVDSGIIAHITKSHESLREDQLTLATHDDYHVDSALTAVSILSEGHFLQVLVGCDTLYRGRSDHIESDDIVIRTLPGSEAEVVAPAWRYVPDLVR